MSNDYISKQEVKGDSNLLKMSFAVSKDTKYRVKDKGNIQKFKILRKYSSSKLKEKV